MNNSAKHSKTYLFKKKIVNLVKKNIFKPIVGVCSISLILLVVFSPVLSILWLCMTSLYLLYIRNYKSIFKIWGFTISIWYLIFSISLHKVTILIGFENTEVIINYLLDNTIFFESLCFQTVYLIDALSAKLGFSIYIPSIINIFSVISKFFGSDNSDDNTKCSNEKNSSNKKNTFSSWSAFGGASSKESQGASDMSKCGSLAKAINKCDGFFHKSVYDTDGKRTVTYSETWIPGLGLRSNCHGRPASSIEKDLFDKSEKK
jgi:hypothetical protein